MSSKSIELPVLGQVLRLNCPEEQHEALKQAAKVLDLRVSEMKERTGILQLERVLSIVALNLSYELLQEQQKTTSIEDLLKTRIQQLDHSLETILTQKSSN
ncbi:cell division protein ZapA [Pasteurella canis]|uniref:Cell division protein ZapA n=1 Tax=Pasteurella canis TaxID=753 RepID=A0A379EWJ2_9PAST|nr:cell division protein ZapA [Pasteurella canis]UAX41612.1 cell division protein ZapA [Pasteurella canis]UAY77118.1 cell division protein ZapA [Pasteurella canis]UDW83168.1 cell division protein ZapA [Pasteurella canis]UEA16255.1 cell division protein ZapA [Pasteurella canis]SPY32623.1 cell division protein ZapA [Pasteurella canis]